MNISVYLFGKFNLGYSQYPDDYTSAIFKKFYENAQVVTQVAIHRDGNLMYYGYIRKLEDDRYIGLCAVINGMYLTYLPPLFSLFENAIAALVSAGRFIHFSENGEIVANAGKLYANKEEIDMLAESLRVQFSRLEKKTKNLPPVNYAKSKDSVASFTIDDPHADIVRSSCENGYTYIYKSSGYNTAQIKSHRNILQKMYDENHELRGNYASLLDKYKSLHRKKKQSRNVIILAIALILCGISIIKLNKRLGNVQRLCDSQQEQLESANTQLNEVVNRFDKLTSSFPYVIYNFSVSTKDYSFDYYSKTDQSVPFIYKKINATTKAVETSYPTIHLSQGFGHISKSYSGSFSTFQTYYVFLIDYSQIVAGAKCVF